MVGYALFDIGFHGLEDIAVNPGRAVPVLDLWLWS